MGNEIHEAVVVHVLEVATLLLSTAVDGPAPLGLIIDPDTLDFLQYSFTCDQATEVLAQRALWRADYRARLSGELVAVEQATVHTVPEPSANALVAAGSALLWLLQHRRDRKIESTDRCRRA